MPHNDIVGNYTILYDKLLGSGSYANVYLGKNIKTSQYVAIKIISNIPAKLIGIFEEEMKIMNIIKNDPHVNIVGCYDVIKHNEVIYIILEYCDSGDLKQLIKNPIKEKYVHYYFKQLVNGLKYLHNKKILHRDIKPKNILLTNNKRVLKICDFGLAKNNEDDHLCKTVCGSPLYMAPEMIKSSGLYNNQIDLWSTGLILYELIYGFHPFHYCKNINDLKANQEIDIPPKVNTNPDISYDCIILLKKLLENDAIHRLSWHMLFNDRWINGLNIVNPGGQCSPKSSNSPIESAFIKICEPENNNSSMMSKNIDLESIIINDYIDKINDYVNNKQEIFDIDLNE